MNFEERRKRTDQLRRIPLPAVLRVWGAQRDHHDKCKWHTPHGTLSVTGAKFINWQSATGGCGAIDLVIHLEHYHFNQARDWLEHHFPGDHPLELEEYPTIKKRPPEQAALIMPTPEPAQLSSVRAYLQRERAIDLSVIEALLETGSLYADQRANAVFVLLGKESRAVGAELRASKGGNGWRGLARGSRKDLGYFSIGDGNDEEDHRPIMLCESAIDAISCSIIHPEYRCISTAGARPNPAWLGPLIAAGRQITCGYDADATGEQIAQAMIAMHPSIKRLRPTLHDWNEELKSRA
jgi:hypothetical protein